MYIMYNHVLYITYWFINAAIFFISSKLFPHFVVVGNHKFSHIEAAVYSAFWVTFAFWVLWDLLASRKIALRNWVVSVLFFWLANSVAIWGAARFSYYIGFGIGSYKAALSMGFVAFMLQMFAFKRITSPKK